MNRFGIGVSAALIGLSIGLTASAQQLTILGRNLQVHGFGSQGFAYSDVNNYLTMKTSDGSFAFTDGGLNVSTQITDQFRVGAQAYVRKIGHLGEGHVTLDWAFGDYRLAKWMGVRAGKVKTVLGLYNDTQDMEFLHTWAILPQSLYPLDLRAYTIAHTGGDIYGDVPLKKYGTLSYTAYAGVRSVDRTSGYYYGSEKRSIILQGDSGQMVGGDLRWTTPLKGLLLGSSILNQDNSASGYVIKTTGNAPYDESTRRNVTLAYYAQYTRGNLKLDGEYRRNYNDLIGAEVVSARRNADVRAWYGAAAYRLHKRLEIGSYYSRMYPNFNDVNLSDPNSHIFDKVATVRVDITRFWNMKVEAHLMDGYGHTSSYRGFYKADQPNGQPEPKTNMIVVRTGFSF